MPGKERYKKAGRSGVSNAEKNPGKLMELDFEANAEFSVIQKLRQQKGHRFEIDFKNSAKYFNCFATKLITGYDGTPFDYYFITPKGAYALELKCYINYNIHYSAIRFNQKQGLEAFERETKGMGKSYILVDVSNILFEKVFLVPWQDIREGVLGKVSGSFDVRDFTQLDHIRLDLEKPDGTQVSEFIWDLEILCGPIKEEYKNAYLDHKDRLADIRRGGFGLTRREAQHVKEAIDHLESCLREAAAAKAAAMGVPPPDFSISDLLDNTTSQRKYRYPITRAPSNGPIRNPDTWGDGKGIGKHPLKKGKSVPDKDS